ncbi:MAG: 4Fe-4S binding protein [Candidatus Thorarchaeota archaeon]
MNDKDDSDPYRTLQEHLDKMPIGFPRAVSGSDIRVLKHLFTPEEAKIAIYLNFGWKNTREPLEEIYERIKGTGISLQEFERNLDNMAKKGVISSKREGSKKFYSNAALIIGMYEFQVNKLTKGFLDDLNEYLGEIWGVEANPTPHPQMRIIPVEVNLETEFNITPYDNVKKIIEDLEGPFAKFSCVCREEMRIHGEPCKMTSHDKNCLGFGDMAQMYMAQGWGTEISKEETLRILQRNKEEGLILRPNNSQEIDFLCSCCYCCDGGISGLLKVPNPADIVTSNYYSEIDPELCTGCGTCVERCQIHAITLTDDKSFIDRKRCIGCGICIDSCPSEAISLQEKEERYVPPSTMDDLYNMILEEKTKMRK